MKQKNSFTADIVDAFNQDAEGYNQNCDLQYYEGKKVISLAIQKTIEIINTHKLTHLRILDAGCGNGRTTINLYIALREALIKLSSNIGITLVGADISEEMLKLAKTNMNLEGISSSSIVFNLKNIEQLSEEDGHFNLIFSNFALHLCSPHVYQSFYNRLLNGGAIVINQGGNYSNNIFFATTLKVAKEPQFENYFTKWVSPFYYPSKKEITDVLNNVGFTNVSVTETSNKNYDNYEHIVEAYINASFKIFQKELPSYEFKKAFEDRFRELITKLKDTHKQELHRLYITADKFTLP